MRGPFTGLMAAVVVPNLYWFDFFSFAGLIFFSIYWFNFFPFTGLIFVLSIYWFDSRGGGAQPPLLGRSDLPPTPLSRHVTLHNLLKDTHTTN